MSMSKKIKTILKEYPNRAEHEKITGLIYQYEGTLEDGCIQIGLQEGAILLFDLARENPDGRHRHGKPDKIG